MKVVYNRCFGGFSLSEAGLRRYAELKGMAFYPEKDEKFSFTVWWTVPPDQRPATLEGAAWHAASMDERKASNEAYRKATIEDRSIPRDDPDLVKVVEELGAAANGMCAELAIEDVPSGSLWRIDEYDGRESVMTQSDYDWKMAR